MSHSKSDTVSSSSRLFKEFPPISLHEWEEQIRRDLNGKDYRELLSWEPDDKLKIMPFYRREDIEPLEYLKQEPGTHPYVRGNDPTGNEWVIREPIYAQATDTANQNARKALEAGAESLSFSMKPHYSEGMLGGDLEGIPVHSQNDFSDLLAEIDLDRVLLYFDTGMATPAYLSMLSNEQEERQVSAEDLKAAFLYDPFTFTVKNGYWPSKPDHFSQIAARMVQYCKENLPHVRPLGVNITPYYLSGASDVQELGIAMAIGQSYLARLTEIDCSPVDVAHHMHFAFPIGTSYFLEIAKLRAARLLWSRILEAYFPANEPPEAATIHATTGSWSHTIYDAYNNMVRNTSQALSAVLGGCDSLSVIPHDIPYKNPNAFSRRIARNIQHIMREESHFDKVADPAGGSYYIEKLTDELARHAWNFFQEIEKQGGFTRAVDEGFIQSVIRKTSKKRKASIATGNTTFVGINNFPDPDEFMLHKLAPSYTTSSLLQSDSTSSVDMDAPVYSLSRIFRQGGYLGDILEDLMHPSRQYLQTLQPEPGPRLFENIRLQTESFAQKTGSRPTVLFLPMGNPAKRTRRVNFVANLIGCAGYKLIKPLGFESIEDAQDTIQNEKPDIIVLCAPDDHYPTMTEALMPWLQKQKIDPIVAIAGDPKDQIAWLQSQGVQHFIHANSNRLKILQALQREIGIFSNREAANNTKS